MIATGGFFIGRTSDTSYSYGILFTCIYLSTFLVIFGSLFVT